MGLSLVQVRETGSPRQRPHLTMAIAGFDPHDARLTTEVADQIILLCALRNNE